MTTAVASDSTVADRKISDNDGEKLSNINDANTTNNIHASNIVNQDSSAPKTEVTDKDDPANATQNTETIQCPKLDKEVDKVKELTKQLTNDASLPNVSTDQASPMNHTTDNQTKKDPDKPKVATSNMDDMSEPAKTLESSSESVPNPTLVPINNATTEHSNVAPANENKKPIAEADVIKSNQVDKNHKTKDGNVETKPITSPMAMDVSLVQRVIMGQCPMDQLPPLPKKIVRIFVSSTFTGIFIVATFQFQTIYLLLLFFKD